MTRAPLPRGRFITLEGGEGAGKSTQVRRLVAALAQRGVSAVATREPGGSPRAEDIRAVLLAGSAERLAPLAETLLFAAARADHLEKTIRPALARSQWVICDRFADSTRAYQGALGGVDAATVTTLERIAVGDTNPDLTLILDLPADIGLARAAHRRGGGEVDRFEQESLAFHQKLREAFLAIAAAEPERCVVIDASGDEGQVAAGVMTAIEPLLR
ncbi:thymidylate kinase [Alsobacter metallidurans]|uniref:Thymidylate kinase n=1 Tax=Alsobacter metallidurans TaxID=340221 RepID=A0A917I8N5_9HYPH|nr:dTMP kinase [Alsobacter metallidurans]GGH20435.1 thymidylate kinase [Alsobacter metallidurans]